MRFICVLSIILNLLASATTQVHAEAFFTETFQTDPFVSGNPRWIQSAQEKYAGQPLKWAASSNPASGFESDKGLLLSEDFKYYGVAKKFDQPLSLLDNKEELVIQYELKFDDTLTCGGAYIKLLRNSPDLDVSQLNNDSPYTIMFGPDKCGSTSKVHFIFQHQSPVTGLWEEKHFSDAPSVTVDKKTHLYTLVVRSDNSFEILVDLVSSKKGDLLTSMSPPINPSAEIDDPEDTKPVDWVDEASIKDPNAVKPEDWDEDQPRMIADEDAVKPAGWLDEAPEEIPDPDAVKPEDWDDVEDGEWEVPKVPNPACETAGCGEWKRPQKKNPAFKGKWTAPMIDNPAYKGPWAPKKIANPNFFTDNSPAKSMAAIGALAVEVWTTNKGFLFDNFLITHSLAEARAFAETTFSLKSAAEKVKEEAAAKESAKQAREEKLRGAATLGLKDRVLTYLSAAVDASVEYATEQPYAIAAAAIVLLLTLVFLLLPKGKSKSSSASTPTTKPSSSSVAAAATDAATDADAAEEKKVEEVVEEEEEEEPVEEKKPVRRTRASKKSSD